MPAHERLRLDELQPFAARERMGRRQRHAHVVETETQRFQPAQVAHAAFVTAFAAPDEKEAMDKQGNVIDPTSPDAAAQFFRSEMARCSELVKKADVKVE